MAMWVWEREKKRMLRCNSRDRGCVACSGQHHVAGNGADFSPGLALETVNGTDAGNKANDDGASRWRAPLLAKSRAFSPATTRTEPVTLFATASNTVCGFPMSR